MKPSPSFMGRRAGVLVGAAALALGLGAIEACQATADPTVAELMAAGKVTFARSLRDAIGDPQRADEALQVFARYESAESEFLEHALDVRARMFELNGDYDASAGDFEPLCDELRAHREQLARAILADFGELKSKVTREEWSEVFEAMRELDENWEALLK